MKKILLLLAAVLLWTSPLWAQTIEVAPGLTLSLQLPKTGWTFAQAPPPFLISQMAEHIHHDLEAQGKSVAEETVEAEARRQLAVNEVFVFNPATGSHLLIDLSAMRSGEKPPSTRALKASAIAAGQSLESEEGVTDVSSKTKKGSVKGARGAYRLDATYKSHGENRAFIGLIGSVGDYWFFLYYTDTLQKGDDLREMEGILANLVFQGEGTAQ